MKAAQLEIGVLRQEAGGKSQKEGARRSVFTNMRCSQRIRYEFGYLKFQKSVKLVVEIELTHQIL
ncbi:hypothetical protein QUB05_13875 [Microcoleus sp. F10-C6]|uniref:hypothetical protein n=1 Tax=unclassified Microcoleus TaxID=2642155 RepID=UPI002FD21C57